MKRIFSIIGLITILSISFIMSDRTAIVVKDIDGLLTKLKEISKNYEQKPENAKIKANTIIPGKYGKKLNIEKTYKEITKIGSINEKYFIYDEIRPEITSEKQYNKYIISGNPTNKMISIIIIVHENDDITQISKMIKNTNTKVNFFLDNNHKGIEDVNKINKEYCYTERENETYIKKCAEQKKYTILPTIIIKSNPLLEIKKQIKNGSIISIKMSNTSQEQLELIINYIKSKGYKIETLQKLLSEKEI